ncbi:serine/threonine-protein phosphatase [Streptomyces sp. TRM66268-LWL]|uniref:Serine/threonine-protein phosphatase n=1 Tax=Streptomyces polyasparticus TaxID=2767826 RepID=A0ABR7SX91_9ACTN|nr:PP2C family protein-serine/threonine phosphatase [Streptomyces polyasparticus]MBC9718948.1 serine/threonine-protein phosphatase [Streptomyces polyasparticus]
MITHGTTHHSLPGLRAALRRLAHQWHLPAELRARLTLSVSTVAAAELNAGRLVTLHVAPEPAPDGRPPELTVRLRTPLTPSGVPAPPNLPLPAEQLPGAVTLWRLPTQAHAPMVESSAGQLDLLEEELRAAVERADALAAEQERLTRELNETNSGVLALYVQLEERDEQLRRAHGRTLRELEDALRPPPVRIPGLEMAVHYAPADIHAPTGGDLYDWFQLPDGSVHITLVDALGHGVTSTRSALNVTHAVRTLALEGHPLDSIVARTDEILLPFDAELMSTVLLVRLDPTTGRLSVANGSHPPPLLVRNDGTSTLVEVRGRGIGYPMPGSDAVRHETLAPGDLLVLYTDGLTESRRNPIEGEARLTAAATRLRHHPIEEIPGALAAELHTQILHPDDTVALAVRRTTPTQGGTP